MPLGPRDLKSTIEEINAWDSKFQEMLTVDCGMPPGSLTRIKPEYLHNWGIDYTNWNREWIKKRSMDSYFDEWESGDERTNEAIEEAAGATVSSGNKNLNQVVASAAMSIMVNMRDMGFEFSERRRFSICDVGAGTGDTSIALISRLKNFGEERLASLCDLYLIEPSLPRLLEADKNLSLLIKKKCCIMTRTHLEHIKLPDGVFDMAISNAALHHMAFPDYLGILHNKLAEHGVMVTGDWFTSIWETPVYMVPFLQETSPARLAQFQDMFKIGDADLAEYESTHPAQAHANKEVLEYLIRLERKSRCLPPGSRPHLLEAFEPLNERLGRMHNAGFITDDKELQENYTGFMHKHSVTKVLPQYNELACVIAAAKRKRKPKPVQIGPEPMFRGRLK